jgi:DNA-directed RNA polymerase subunit RPC12/RpoP
MYSCQKCKKRFTYVPKSRCEEHDSICPHCGSKDVKKEGVLNFFRGLLSSGGG